jgi:AcrR family transcriptional regulator
VARPHASEDGPGVCVRGVSVVRAVLAAALDELARVGYGALNIEQVARRAGVNKTTVYRRWPTKAELVAAALDSGCAEVPLVESGDVRADLLQLARRMSGTLSSPRGRGLLRTVVAGCAESDLFAVASSIRRRNEAPAIQLVERAVKRGELRGGLDAGMLLHALSGWLVHTILREGADPTDAELRALVELLLDGAAPRAVSRRRAAARARAPRAGSTRTRAARRSRAGA